MDSELFERWLPAYREGADAVAADLGHLFQEAMTYWDYDQSSQSLGITRSREFLKGKRAEFPHRIVLFLYSSQFDEGVEGEILGSDESRAEVSGSLTPREILSRKAQLLEPNFKQLVHDAHVLADHYTVALSANERLRTIPLVWETPAEAESKTGFSPDYMWQAPFYFLCEISRAIVAYGGYSKSFRNEITYVRGEPDLSARLLWLDQNGELFFPDRQEETWPLSEIANVIARVAT